MEAEWRIGERLIEETERRIGERLNELDQWYDKFDARLDEMLKAVTAIKDRLQGSGGATAMVDVESNRESLVEEDDPIVQLRSLKQVSHIRSYIEDFDELNSKAGIQEDQALSLFLSGLVDEIRVPVCLFTPKTLEEAYALSKLQELTLTGVFWCDREESNLRRNEKLDVNSKVEGLNYEFDESSEFADMMETDKEVSEGVSSGSDEGGDGLVNFGNSLNFFLRDAKAEKRLNHDKTKETELGQHVTDFSEYNTFSQENKLKEAECVPSVRQIAAVKDIAVTLNVVSNLTRRPVRFPKPMVKLKFMAKYGEEMGGECYAQWVSAKAGEHSRKLVEFKEENEVFETCDSVDVSMFHFVKEDLNFCEKEIGKSKSSSMYFDVDVKESFDVNPARLVDKEETYYANFSASLAVKIMLSLAFNSNNYLSLKWLPILSTKPTVKMKLMVVPVNSCKVLKRGGMTRATHTYTQHDEVIGGELGKQIDLDVESAAMWQQRRFQYRDENWNRTIVHLGQRFGGFFTDEGLGAFGFVDDRKEQGSPLEFISSGYEIMLMDHIVTALGLVYDDSNNKMWRDGSCKECPRNSRKLNL